MKTLLIVGALLVMQTGSAIAQNPNAFAMAADYAKSAKENAASLRQYTWDMRVSVTKDGEPKPPRLYLVRFTVNGNLEKTLLTPAPELRGGPIRRTIEQEKMVLVKERADKIADVVKKYTTPTPGTMLDFYMQAKYTKSADGMLEISGTDFVTPGDTAEFWVDEKTKKPHRFAFTTSMDDNPLAGTVTYEQMPSGPLYAGRIDLTIEANEVGALIETFNYQKSN